MSYNVKNPLIETVSGPLSQVTVHPLIVRSFAQVGTFQLWGCRGFAGPMYLHHSE